MRSLLFVVGVVFAAWVLPVSEARGQDANQVNFSDIIFLASQGNTTAQFEVGKAYFTGKGISLDKNAAVTFFKLAAEGGHTQSQALMGSFYTTGQGVGIDFEKSVKWYRRAAVKGYAPAQLGLAGAYKDGNSVPKNDITAYAWYVIYKTQNNITPDGFKAEFEAGMSQEDIIKAQKLANQCLASNYENCG